MIMNENKCSVHGLFFDTTCSWCSDRICKNCIEACDDRKYCIKCYSKFSKGSVAGFLEKRKVWGEKPDTKITNIDPELSEEEIKQMRQALEIKERARKIMSETGPKIKKY